MASRAGRGSKTRPIIDGRLGGGGGARPERYAERRVAVAETEIAETECLRGTQPPVGGRSMPYAFTAWAAICRLLSRYRLTSSRAAIPSPTADPSCLVDPARTSPAQKTPGCEVA